MEGIFGSLDWPSVATWGAFAFGAVVAVVAQTHGHVRQAFHQWRLDRRLARDPYILREEMNEYGHAIGGDLEPLQARSVIGRSLVAGLAYAVAGWLYENDLDQWRDIAEGAFIAGALLLVLWRWLNNPRDLHEREPEEEDSDYLQREAGIDFVSAVIVVLLLLFGVAAIF